jgi:patatin-like phospholipase/acyl hydrolase
MSVSSENLPSLRILSLGSGGVKGTSSLYILKELIVQASLQLAADKLNKPRLISRLYQVFNIICETSIEGLIALILGRLEMVNSPLFSFQI